MHHNAKSAILRVRLGTKVTVNKDLFSYISRSTVFKDHPLKGLPEHVWVTGIKISCSQTGVMFRVAKTDEPWTWSRDERQHWMDSDWFDLDETTRKGA